MEEKLIKRIPVGEDREIRITELDTEQIRFVRIGSYLNVDGEERVLSGVVFPPRLKDDLIKALERVKP